MIRLAAVLLALVVCAVVIVRTHETESGGSLQGDLFRRGRNNETCLGDDP